MSWAGSSSVAARAANALLDAEIKGFIIEVHKSFTLYIEGEDPDYSTCVLAHAQSLDVCVKQLISAGEEKRSPTGERFSSPAKDTAECKRIYLKMGKRELENAFKKYKDIEEWKKLEKVEAENIKKMCEDYILQAYA